MADQQKPIPTFLTPGEAPAETEFLSGLYQPDAGQTRKTDIVVALMKTKGYDDDQIRLLGCAREDGRTFYYFEVKSHIKDSSPTPGKQPLRIPGSVVEIEICWNPDTKRYERRFSNTIDDENELREMLGRIP